MSIAPEILEAMKDAGASIDVILAAIRADAALAERAVEERRAKDRERQRRHRMSRDVTVTNGAGCDTPPMKENNLTPPKTPSKPKGLAAPKPVKHSIPDDWQPKPFGAGSKSREMMDTWPEGELEAQLEQFKASHRAKGNKFLDPQDAWQTWVLNTRKFGIGKPQNGMPKYVSASGYAYHGSPEQVQREAQKRGDNDTYWQVEVDRKRGVQSAGDAAKSVLRSAAHG